MNVARQSSILLLIQLLVSMFLVSDVVGIIRHNNEEHISGDHIAELRKKAEQGNAHGQYHL